MAMDETKHKRTGTMESQMVDFVASSTFSKLTIKQIAVLTAICENVLSESKDGSGSGKNPKRLTDAMIAEQAGVCVNTVRNCRKNPHFCEALASMSMVY